MRRAIWLAALAGLALAGNAGAQPAITKPQAKAIIRDVNLKPSDMAGYDAAPADPMTAADRRADARLARCTGGIPLSKALANGSSQVFTRGTATDFDLLASGVLVFRKAALVRKDLRALRTARARECLRAAIESAAASVGPGVAVTVTTLQTSVKGVFGYRFTSEQDAPGSPGPVHSDLFFMGTRSTEARVAVNAHPGEPAQTEEDRVVRILKTRLDLRVNPNAIV